MTEKKTRWPLRIAKIAGSALAVVVIIVVAAVFWLRSSAGSEFVFKQVVKILADSGLHLSADEFSGPLPGRLYIRNLILADKEGPLIKADLAEIKLAPMALLGRTAHIPLIQIEKPQIIGLPESRSEEKEESGEFSLPVKIRLDKLLVADGRLEHGALSSLGILNPEISFKAEGQADLIGPGSKMALSANIDGNEGRELLALKLSLTDDGTADKLFVDLAFNDEPGGLLSSLLNDYTWPGLKLNLQAQGPLNNWNGRLELAAGEIADLSADLEFKGRNGRLWADIVKNPAWVAAIKADLTAKNAFPPQATQLLGQKTALQLNSNLTGQDLEADVLINGSSGLALNSQLSGRLASGGGDFKLTALLSGLKHPGIQSEQSLRLAADAHLDEKVKRISGLSLNGSGLALEASAEQNLGEEALKAALTLKSDLQSSLLETLLYAAGLGFQAFGGLVELKADLDWRGFEKAAQGQVSLKGQELKWPGPELEKLIGPDLVLEARLGGGGDHPLELTVDRASGAQIDLQGKAGLSPVEELIMSPFDIEARLRLADLSALKPDMAGEMRVALNASGQADDMKGQFHAASGSLTLAPGDFRNFDLKLTLAGDLISAAQNETAQGITLAGDLDLSAADSPGGPLSLTSGWDFKQSDGKLDLAITNLLGDLADVKLSGDIKALIAEDKRLDGKLDIDVAGWDKLAALSGQKFSGSPAKMHLSLSSAEGGQSAKALLDLPDLKLGSGKETVLSLKKTALNFQGRNLFSQPTLDLDLSLGAGLAGPFSWQSGSARAKGQDGKGDLEARLNQARLSGSGGSKSDGLKLDAKYDLTEEPVLEIDLLDFNLAGSGLNIKDKTTVSLGDNLTISPVTVNFKPTGRLAAKVDLTPGAMTIKAEGAKIPFKAFKAFTPDSMPDGEIQSLNIDLNQGQTGLAGSFDLKTMVAAKELRNIKPVLTVKGDLSSGSDPALMVSGKIDGGSGWKSNGDFNGRLPLSPGADGGLPQVNINAPLSADLKFVGPIRPLWFLAGQPDRSVNGMLQVEARLAGSLAKPLPSGSLYLAGGRFEDSVLGLLINNINIEAHSSPELPLKALLSAEDGKKGGLALEAQLRDLKNPTLLAKGRMNHFSPTHRDDIVVFISGDFGAEGPLDRLSLSSNLTVDQGELDLQIIAAGGSVPTLPISNIGDGLTKSSRGMRSDIKVNIPGRFFIRGPGLESEWRGSIAMGGSTGNPSLTGQIGPIRGYYTFAAKEFQFSGGEISFSGGTTPILNLALTNKTPGLTAILRFGGTATKPTLTMESQPPLPEEEVLSHVLFGKSASSISRFEALQLASAINDLRNFGSSGFNALSMVRTSLGLDVLRLGGSNENRERQVSSMSGTMGQQLGGNTSTAGSSTEQSDDISIEAGKYISDNIYVGVEHSGVGGAAVRLEVELAPSVSLEARSSTESSRVGVGWKKDY